MKLSAFTPSFLEAVRKMIDKHENYEWSYDKREYIRKRDRGPYDAALSQKEAEYVKVLRITDFEDFTHYGGYCETCSYEETRCNVTYETDQGMKIYEYYGSFASLINDLTRDD